MIRLLHVSDLHIHHRSRDNRMAASLIASAVERIAAEPAIPTWTLITGDLLDDGDPEQIEAAVHLLAPLRGRLLIAPGNHDYGPLGNMFCEESARRFDATLLPELGLDDEYLSKRPTVHELSDGAGTRLLAIGLNSNLQTHTVLDFARGEIGIDQLQALDGLLSDPRWAGVPRLAYLHHRPQRRSFFLELVDSEDLMAVLSNRVDVVAFGHTGGSEGKSEPPQAHMMNVVRQRWGVPWLLNANTSVSAQRMNEVTIEGRMVAARTVRAIPAGSGDRARRIERASLRAN